MRSKLVARGIVGQLELWLPHDSTDEYSRVFSFYFNSGIRYRQTTHIEQYFDEASGAFLNSITVRNDRSTDLCVYELGLKMYNRHLLDRSQPSEQQDISSERLLTPSRVAVGFEESFNLDINLTRRAIKVNIEPLDFQLGYREIDFFQTLSAKYK